ncbi:glycosyltransferase [Rhodoferax sp. U2-2l]|uniref:glycosyltransferase n=1 Tax=Rhodoferax sp. U2-2l TaxID=2884000 RepID=UPI001D09D7B7|nr:glycosyltransferase [Rhodoferax sp. U2-2l]MCB8747864.1 glycosyltransferase [Rhodoferax sp. U2-2l]
MKVSVIVPSYNAADKIGRCLNSLRQITLNPADFEVVFVDDCSTDGTYELLSAVCTDQPNWQVLRLEKNSGSPSRPRNLGIDAARGEYLYFLDCDDELLPGALEALLKRAKQTDACLIRSELLVDDGRGRKLMNQIPGWSKKLGVVERRGIVMTRTSTVVASFVKCSLLRSHQIQWPEKIRMGEDTVFLAEVLMHSKRIEYLPEPTFVYYKLPSLTPASTQRYGKRELLDHLQVWTAVQAMLLPLGVDYYKGRLPVGLRVALESLIFRNRGDVDEVTFHELHQFVSKNWLVIGQFRYTARLMELLGVIQTGDYGLFKSLCRPRMVIAGHDLKFIQDAVPALAAHFDIRFDEWKGHELHDEKKSKALLDWAEYIWCEWLLKNAEWYATHKRPDQRLVARMHRMELGRVHGEKLDMSKVDAIVAVSTFFFERLLERYPNIPRHKVRLIPNYVRVDEYRTDWHADRLFTLGLIGILPSRKGYHRALEILQALRLVDKRFRLEVFSKHPSELTWIARDTVEMAYFQQCEQYIQQHQLQDAVHFNGHVDIKEALAARRVGYVLSVSESEFDFPGPESFHLAVADAFASNGMSFVRRWPGAEYIWPATCLKSNHQETVDAIIKVSKDSDLYKARASLGKELVEERYNHDKFILAVSDLYQEI